MTDIEFKAWPKIARLNRDITITEKIDGTNAAIIVSETGDVGAQSRNRLITPDSDNFGFARWVQNHAPKLADLLGPGHHFGEWWGAGIQRAYGLSGEGGKRFSLFNTSRWADEHGLLSWDVYGLGVVPVLYEGPFCEGAILDALARLRGLGSVVEPGFQKPEGIVIYHHAANQMFKVTLEGDEAPKGMN